MILLRSPGWPCIQESCALSPACLDYRYGLIGPGFWEELSDCPLKQVVRFLAHLWAFLTLAAKEQPYPEDISRTLYKWNHLSHFLPVCHYWIVFFSPFVSPGQSLLPQAQHESTRTHTNLPFSSNFNFTTKTLVSRKHASNLSAFFLPHLSADLVGKKRLFLLWFSLLMFSSVFTSGTVMWGFRSTKLLIRRQGVQARVKGLILGYAVLCSSRSSLYAPELCTTLCPGSFLARWWIFALPAHLP